MAPPARARGGRAPSFDYIPYRPQDTSSRPAHAEPSIRTVDLSSSSVQLHADGEERPRFVRAIDGDPVCPKPAHTLHVGRMQLDRLDRVAAAMEREQRRDMLGAEFALQRQLQLQLGMLPHAPGVVLGNPHARRAVDDARVRCVCEVGSGQDRRRRERAAAADVREDGCCAGCCASDESTSGGVSGPSGGSSDAAPPYPGGGFF
jgi:hypothetical protein